MRLDPEYVITAYFDSTKQCAARAVYLNLTNRPIKDSAQVTDGIVVDYDNDGRIVGI